MEHNYNLFETVSGWIKWKIIISRNILFESCTNTRDLRKKLILQNRTMEIQCLVTAEILLSLNSLFFNESDTTWCNVYRFSLAVQSITCCELDFNFVYHSWSLMPNLCHAKIFITTHVVLFSDLSQQNIIFMIRVWLCFSYFCLELRFKLNFHLES